MKKEQKEKLIVYSVAALIFIVICWFIFAPESSANESGDDTFNTSLPDGSTRPLAESKRDAYDQHRDRKRESMKDFATMYDLTSSSSESEVSLKIENTDLLSTAKQANIESENMRASMEIEREYQALVQEKLALEQELRERDIHRRQEALENSRRQANAQIKQANEMMANNNPMEVDENDEADDEDMDYQETGAVRQHSVSSLHKSSNQQPIERQHGFNTPVGSGYEMGANTIRACIHEEQTLTDGQRVRIRLLEPLRAGSVTLPAGQVIAGQTRLQKDRLEIYINSVEYKGNIIPVSMSVYDMDGSTGIYCPGSEELNAMKEATANIGSSLGSSISFAQSAGQQIAMDVTRGVISGGSQYLSKKMRVVKVKLKENYQVLLLPKKK